VDGYARGYFLLGRPFRRAGVQDPEQRHRKRTLRDPEQGRTRSRGGARCPGVCRPSARRGPGRSAHRDSGTCARCSRRSGGARGGPDRARSGGDGSARHGCQARRVCPNSRGTRAGRRADRGRGAGSAGRSRADRARAETGCKCGYLGTCAHCTSTTGRAAFAAAARRDITSPPGESRPRAGSAKTRPSSRSSWESGIC
jgi:hypothetical protein